MHERRGPRWVRHRNQALGLVFLVVLGMLGALAVAIYQKAFSNAVVVTLQTDRVGTQLRSNSDVKVLGVEVGKVHEVRTTGTGADVVLHLDPDHAETIPDTAVARLLPKTLFGQRYVKLMLPKQTPDAETLTSGDVIQQDTSKRAIELEQALRNLMPMLQAVQPEKLSVTLGAIAEALQDRGEQVGKTLVLLDEYLSELNPELPKLTKDIRAFADLMETYEEAGPDIVDALSDLTTTSKTIVEQRDDLVATLSGVTTASQSMEKFLRANSANFITLAKQSRPTLQTLATYSDEFPCLTQAAVALKPVAEKAFGAGTNKPGLHVKVSVQREHGGGPVNRPSGPRCYPAGGGGSATQSGPWTAPEALPNSAAESTLINELIALDSGASPAELPSWSSLLVGPLFRGTEVIVE